MFSCEYWGVLKTKYLEEHLATTTSVDTFKTFRLQCFDFMANTVCIICIIWIIMLSVKFKIKICLIYKIIGSASENTK